MNSRAAAVPTSKRLLWLAACTFAWAVLIILRLVQLQVFEYRQYRQSADRQQNRLVEVRPPRGAVFDRSGHPLAMSLPAETVCINPRRVPDRVVAAEILSSVLSLDRQDLYAKIEAAARARRGFLPIKKKVTPEESQKLHSLNLEWIEFRTESQRYYPKGQLAANVIGAVDFEEKGNLGLERSLDKDLRGRTGEVRMLTDVRQRGIESEVEAPVEPGVNLTLSIDERIQFAAERELAAAVQEYHAKTGSVVVMDPYQGDILAMANYPTFDPNVPPAKGENPQCRFNEATAVPFEPGSVFKVVTLSGAIDQGLVTPDTLINCGGGAFNLFGRVIHEAKHGYGTLSVAEVLAKSSNIGAIQVGLRLGNERLLDYVKKFGFGKKAGLPLAESRGMVRELKYWGKTSIGSVAMGHEISTTTIQLARACSVVANGGLLVKPRLILRRERPGAPAVNEPVEKPVRIIKPETAIKMRQMMEGVVLFGTGKKAKLDGYTSGGKTGSAQIFDFATKHYTHLYNGSFIGFAPVGNPRIVIAVTLNGTTLFGGVVAAPVFRNVAMEALRILEVPKDLPENVPPPEVKPEDTNDLAIAEMSNPPDALGPSPEAVSEIAAPGVLPLAAAATKARGLTPVTPATLAANAAPALMAQAGPPVAGPQLPQAVTVPQGPPAPSFLGKTMRAVLAESIQKGVQVEVMGNGIARAQMPPPGAAMIPGQRIRVQFAR